MITYSQIELQDSETQQITKFLNGYLRDIDWRVTIDMYEDVISYFPDMDKDERQAVNEIVQRMLWRRVNAIPKFEEYEVSEAVELQNSYALEDAKNYNRFELF